LWPRWRREVEDRSWSRFRTVPLFHEHANPMQVPEVTYLRRSLANAEDRGDLGEGQVLEVARLARGVGQVLLQSAKRFSNIANLTRAVASPSVRRPAVR